MLSRLIGPLDRPWHWLGIALVALGLDVVTSPFVRFPIVFVVPVAAAAWHRGLPWGGGLAVALPLARLGVALVTPPPEPWLFAVVNAGIRLAVLGLLAGLIAALARQVRELEGEVQALTGLLPICAHCKKIRDEAGAWHRLESYLASRTEASFTHGICPECTALHFPEMGHDA